MVGPAPDTKSQIWPKSQFWTLFPWNANYCVSKKTILFSLYFPWSKTWLKIEKQLFPNFCSKMTLKRNDSFIFKIRQFFNSKYCIFSLILNNVVSTMIIMNKNRENKNRDKRTRALQENRKRTGEQANRGTWEHENRRTGE